MEVGGTRDVFVVRYRESLSEYRAISACVCRFSDGEGTKQAQFGEQWTTILSTIFAESKCLTNWQSELFESIRDLADVVVDYRLRKTISIRFGPATIKFWTSENGIE